MSLYILDTHGELVHMERMDGQVYNNIRTAYMKAETARKSRGPTSVFNAQLKNNPAGTPRTVTDPATVWREIERIRLDGVALAVEDVAFTYPNGRRVLDGFSLHVEPGETVALIGPSGAGKSTVCSLVLRLYAPDRGRITLKGVDIAELAEAERKAVER